MMAEGVNGVFILKQHDFLLLGIDHLVHTWNALRIRKHIGSFTILAIVVDNGYEGPQSCINNLPDLSSISRIPSYSIANKNDADAIINGHFAKPGVRMIGVSQNLFRSELSGFDSSGKLIDSMNLIHQYGIGEETTVVSQNFAFSEARRLIDVLKNQNIDASLFNVAVSTPNSWAPVIEHAARTKRVVICDDTKSRHKASTELAYLLHSQIPGCKVVLQNRAEGEIWSLPQADQYLVQDAEVVSALSS